MKEIHQTYHINAPIEKVWQALVDPKLIEKWSSDEAKMSDRDGDTFELWEGWLTGKNKKVEPFKKLVQDWRASDWPKEHYSEVSFELTKEGDGTKLDLKHSHVPDERFNEIDQGWHDYYLGQIKKLLES